MMNDKTTEYGFCCTCEHGWQDINEQPCVDCEHLCSHGTKDNWKEKDRYMERLGICEDCYFNRVDEDIEPCNACYAFDGYIPASAPEGYCATCRSSESDTDEYPCDRCVHIGAGVNDLWFRRQLTWKDQ